MNTHTHTHTHGCAPQGRRGFTGWRFGVAGVALLLATWGCDQATHGTEATDGAECDCMGSMGGDTGGCELPPEQGAALMDFGRCRLMGTDQVIGACGNTGVHRRCDAVFLEWCNAQNADLSACREDEALTAMEIVPCGTGGNAALCDLPFKDNCDSLNGNLVCTTGECSIGACILPPDVGGIECRAQITCPDGTAISCSTPPGVATTSCSETATQIQCVYKTADGEQAGNTYDCP